LGDKPEYDTNVLASVLNVNKKYRVSFLLLGCSDTLGRDLFKNEGTQQKQKEEGRHSFFGEYLPSSSEAIKLIEEGVGFFVFISTGHGDQVSALFKILDDTPSSKEGRIFSSGSPPVRSD
jgi:hypothetical protein